MSFSVGQPEQSGLDVILQGLGQGAGAGLQESLARFHEQQIKDKQVKGLEKFIPKEKAASILNQPKELQKTLLYQALAESQFPSSQGGGSVSTGTSPSNQLKQASDDQLKFLLNNPIYKNSAQAELDERNELHKDIRRSDIKRSDKYLDKINESRSSLQRSTSSLAAAEEALANKDLGFFSRDNLARVTGIEGLASPEGAVFNASAKDFFLSDIERIVGRPNQFLEKVLQNAIFNVGKSNEANEALIDFYKNTVDIEKEKIRISDNLEDYYRNQLGYVPGNIGRLVDQQLKPYVEQKEKDLKKKFENSPLINKTTSKKNTTLMTDPSGALREVDKSQVLQAQSAGYKLKK